MTVYVDPAVHHFGRMIMGHMWADRLDELHAMAQRIGLKRAWFQTPPKASWNHYDVCRAFRAKAIVLGAVETDRYGPLEHEAHRKGDVAMLGRIERLRRQAEPRQEALPL